MRQTRSFRSPLLSGNGPLARVPPLAAFVLVIALFAGGVLIKGAVGAGLLALLAAGVGVLLAATWRVLTPVQRLARVAVFGVLVLVIVSVL